MFYDYKILESEKLIGPVNFTSRFVANFTKNDIENNPDIEERLRSEGIKQGVTEYNPINKQGAPIKNKHGVLVVKTTEYIAHDFDDAHLTYFLSNRGIEFKKISPQDEEQINKDKISPQDEKRIYKDKILSKIVRPKGLNDDYKLITVNATMLEYIANKHVLGNFDSCRKLYLSCHADSAEDWVENSKEIEAPILRISPVAGNIVVIDRNYASCNYDKCSIMVDFPYIHPYDENRTSYFALRDAGLNEIPVCVDSETYSYCKSFGLISKE